MLKSHQLDAFALSCGLSTNDLLEAATELSHVVCTLGCHATRTSRTAAPCVCVCVCDVLVSRYTAASVLLHLQRLFHGQYALIGQANLAAKLSVGSNENHPPEQVKESPTAAAWLSRSGVVPLVAWENQHNHIPYLGNRLCIDTDAASYRYRRRLPARSGPDETKYSECTTPADCTSHVLRDAAGSLQDMREPHLAVRACQLAHDRRWAPNIKYWRCQGTQQGRLLGPHPVANRKGAQDERACKGPQEGCTYGHHSEGPQLAYVGTTCPEHRFSL
jgi:hypothetical protein